VDDAEEDGQIFGGNEPPAGDHRTHPSVQDASVKQVR
jgi:hypothetical protein